MSALDRQAILGMDDLPRVRVEVPEWGGALYVRSLTGAERDAFEATWFAGEGRGRTVNMANLRARLVVLCAVDEDGIRLFADDDAEALGAKSAQALDRLFDAAQKLNGFSEADVEELAKN